MLQASLLGQVLLSPEAEHQQLQPDTSSSSEVVLDIYRNYIILVGDHDNYNSITTNDSYK